MHVRSIPSHGSQARDRERLLANLAIRRDIVQIADVKLVDLRNPHGKTTWMERFHGRGKARSSSSGRECCPRCERRNRPTTSEVLHIISSSSCNLEPVGWRCVVRRDTGAPKRCHASIQRDPQCRPFSSHFKNLSRAYRIDESICQGNAYALEFQPTPSHQPIVSLQPR
jgi:hypothetical protein